jgi:class 3 adenylate cyclase
MRHPVIVREALQRFSGHEVDTAGDGFLATFENPAQAVTCACELLKTLDEAGISVRAGIHTGECEVLDGRVTGIAVHLGARIAARATASELLSLLDRQGLDGGIWRRLRRPRPA